MQMSLFSDAQIESITQRIEQLRNNAEANGAMIKRDPIRVSTVQPIARASKVCGNSAKFRELADRMQKDIDHKFGNRLENTPKRQREANAQRIDGRNIQRAHEALRVLADLIDAGTLPAGLACIKSKAEVLQMTRKSIISHSYYHIGESDKFADNSETAFLLRETVKNHTDSPERREQLSEQKRRHDIKELEAKVRFAKIEGFFPTPEPIIEMMLQRADLIAGDLVLEPSAGKGDIADAVRLHGVQVDCIERNHSLCEILRAKGHKVEERDFLTDARTPPAQYDCVLINPPFENGQDIDHVLRAFGYLAECGRLIAIMSARVKFRDGMKWRAFRDWLRVNNGEIEDLPADSFKSGFVQTGVSTVIVTVRR